MASAVPTGFFGDSDKSTFTTTATTAVFYGFGGILLLNYILGVQLSILPPPRNDMQVEHYTKLARMAEFLSIGGDTAFAETAHDLQITEQALRDWWVHWNLGMAGPRRSIVV